MDALGLLIDLKDLIVMIDEAVESYYDAHDTLAVIKSQIHLLDAGIEQVQTWLDQSAATAKKKILKSLDEALETVRFTVQRLRSDLKEVIGSGKASKWSAMLTKTKFATGGETRLRKRLTDVRECVSLVHFSLTVCQLPVEDHANHAKELQLGAKTLRRTQKYQRQQQRTEVITSEISSSKSQSSDFQQFLQTVLAVETEREQDHMVAQDDDGDNDEEAGDGAAATAAVAAGTATSPRSGSVSAHTGGAHGASDYQATALRSPPSTGALNAPPLSSMKSQESIGSRAGASTLTTSAAAIERQRSPPLPFRQPSIIETASRPKEKDSVESTQLSTANNPDGTHASRPSHMSLSEGSFSTSKSAEAMGSSPRTVSRKPVLSMMSTAIPTSPRSDGSGSPTMDMPPIAEAPGPATASDAAQSVPIAGPAYPSHSSDNKVMYQTLGDPDSKSRPLQEEEHDQPPPAYGKDPDYAPRPIMSPQQSSSGIGVDVNKADEAGCPYVVKAAQENLTAVIKVLIERGVDLEAVDLRTNRNAVMEAARLGRDDIVELLINAGCRLDHVDAEGNTALHFAVLGGSTQILKQILITNRVNVDTRGLSNRTALHVAAEQNDAKMTMVLVRHKADPNLKDAAQQTPLHIAASHGSVMLCEILLDEGAVLDSYDAEGQTPLQRAAGTDRGAAVTMLLSRSDTSKSNDAELLKGFYEAVKLGNVRMTRDFLDKGIKLKKLKEAWKPAAYAAQSGNLDMLRLMIENKCSLKEKSPEGWTPLHTAAHLGHAGMVQRLLDEKVAWKAATKERQETALHLAIAAGHASAAEALIKHKDASINVSDADNQEPLHYAIRQGLESIAQALLGAGAKTNTENKYGWRPLHVAAAYGHVTLAADLIGRGVSVEEKLGTPAFKAAKQTHAAVRRGYWAEARWPAPGSRPLALALEFGQDGVARMLLAHGAKLDAGDTHGWRPLHHAAFAGSPEMVEALLARGAQPHAATSDNNTPLALGFRTSGLHATRAQREQVRALLQDAMAQRRASKLDALRRGVAWAGTSTTALRNQAWHTAEMAAALLARHDSAAALSGGMPSALAPDDGISSATSTATPPLGPDDAHSVASGDPPLGTRPSNKALRLGAASGIPSVPSPVLVKSPTASSLASTHVGLRVAELPVSEPAAPAELGGPEIAEMGDGAVRRVELPSLPAHAAIELPAELPG